MSDANRCPACGGELPGEGPCPRCLVGETTSGVTLGPALGEGDDGPATVAFSAGSSPSPQAESEATGGSGTRPVAGEAPTVVDPARGGATGPAETIWTPDDRRSISGLAADTVVGYFGDYEIQGELGRGAMGVVYRARQVSLNRFVALKMIKAGMLAGEEELRRFQNEAEAVGLLDHPGIVPVYEVGEHQGQRYFSMKLIEGGTLGERLATFKDDPEAAAVLMAETAEAIHHAHMRGILHRDLKPANILVDAGGHPAVTDFGLAKLVQDDAEMTQSGAILGTPSYMSPEQAAGHRASITTATDVYGLGAILYALLAGKAPFAGDSVMSTLDAVRSRPPDSPRRLNARVPRDLETICLKCLDKDPRRRYASAHSLADDLKNWLESRPISARRVGPIERARLWCGRRPAVAALAATLVLAALGGTAAVIAVEARANRLLGRKNLELRSSNARLDEQRIRALTAEGETRKRADELQKVSDFQSRMLAQVDPTSAGLRLTADVTGKFDAVLAKAGTPADERARQAEAFAGLWSRVNATDAALDLIDGTILRPAVEAIGKQFRDQPLVDAALRETLGERYRELGLYDAARPLLERALETRRRLLGDDHLDTLVSMSHLGTLIRKQGKYAEAMPYCREALGTSRRALGEDHRNTLGAITNMGSVLSELGKPAEAAPFYREALEKYRRLFGDDDPETLSAISNMGTLLKDQGKPNEALPLYREALERRRRVLGGDHNDTLTSLDHMGSLLLDLGQVDEAVASFREVLEKRRRLLGEVHPDTLSATRNLGATLDRAGKKAESEALLREALANDRRLLGADHPSTLVGLNNLAVFLINEGKPAEAEPMCRESLEKNRRLLGGDHPHTLVAASVMGYVLLRQGKPAEAEPFVRETVAISRKVQGEDHPETFTFIHNLGMVLNEQGKLVEAEPVYRDVVERGGRVLGPDHVITLTATTNLGTLLNKQERFEESAGLLAAAEPRARKGTDAPSVRNLALLLTRLGVARAALKRFEAAEASLLEAHPLWVKARGEAHKDTRACKQAIVDLYTGWDAARPGQGYDAKAKEWKAKLPAA